MKTHEQFGTEASQLADTLSARLTDELHGAVLHKVDFRAVLFRALRSAYVAGGKSALQTGGLS